MLYPQYLVSVHTRSWTIAQWDATPPTGGERRGDGGGCLGASGCEGQPRGQCVLFTWLPGKMKTFNPLCGWNEKPKPLF